MDKELELAVKARAALMAAINTVHDDILVSINAGIPYPMLYTTRARAEDALFTLDDAAALRFGSTLWVGATRSAT